MYPLYTLYGIVTFVVLRSIYRLFFHPLRKIPGPRLAALSYLYEFYYDVVCKGSMMRKLESLHKQYGPIVRINPNDIHSIDPDFYDEIYASTPRRREKDPRMVRGFGLPTSLISTISHDHHRFRRGLLTNFFSRQSVLQLESMVSERITQLTRRLEEFERKASVVQLDDAFSALTADIISYYAYGKSFGFLEDEKFSSHVRTVINETVTIFHIARFFGFAMDILNSIPRTWLGAIFPGKGALFEFLDSLSAQSAEALQAQGYKKPNLRGTIYDSLVHSEVPAEERTTQRLQDESLLVLAAGTETTGRALTVGFYHISRDEKIRNKLRDEVKTVLPTITSTAGWIELERLPYLTAVVNECLRMSYGVVARLNRVAPTENLTYKDMVIPAGTPMSSSAFFIHNNADIFPSPEQFRPERWIEASQEGKQLSKYLVQFTRGSRACLGMNLAYIELFMTIAYVVRQFDFEMVDTTDEDVRVVRDMGMGYTARGDMRVYAKVGGVK